MLLKSLEIKGFKSFADPVTIDFEPGITVIVGPNGSGKSNIVDAICWAMGTQAISTLRTSSMQEVIFEGSPGRKPLGRAKVTITFDNSDRSLPVDFAEVAISRTLYRSGESEYAINGAPCRLLDIQELLADTGVGRQLHSIVGQGQVEAVLTASPEDRRAMIEEAAGVLKYKRRKERALRRLRSTEENLSRLQDVVKEIERQIRPLKRQARAVERYREVSAEANALRTLLARRKLAAARDSHHAATERMRASRSEVERLESVVESLRRDARAIESEESDVLSSSNAIEEAARKVAELRRLCGAIGDLAREKKKFFETVALKSASQHLDLLGAEKEQLDEKIAEHERVIPVLREELQAAIEEERRLVAEVESYRAQIDMGSEAALRAAELGGERSSLESAIARAEIEVSQLVERKLAAENRRAALIEERKRLNEEIQRLDAQAGPLSEEVVRLRSHRDIARGEIELLERQKSEAESELAMWNGRLEALRELATKIAGTEGPSRLIEAEPPGLVGSVWDLVEVDRGSEIAVEAALGDLARAVVIDGAEGIAAAAAILEEEDAGGAWLVDLRSLEKERGIRSRVRGGPVDSVPSASEATPLMTLVRSRRSDTRFDRLLDLLLSRCYLAPDWASAVELAGRFPELTFVTNEGRVAGAGVYRVGRSDIGPLSQLASLSDVAAKARTWEDRLKSVCRSIERRRSELAAIESDLTTTEATLAECDAMLTAAAGELARIDPELESVEQECAALKKAESSLIARIGEDRKKLGEIETFLADIRRNSVQVESEGRDEQEALSRLSQIEQDLSAARERRRELEKSLAGAEERHVVLSSRRDQLAAKLDEEMARLRIEEERRRRALSLAQRSRAAEEAAARLLSDVSQLEEAAAGLLEAIRPMRDAWRRKISGVHKRLEESSAALSSAKEAYRQNELEHMRASTVLQQVESEYQATVGALPDDDDLAAGGKDLEIPEELRQMDDESARAHLKALEKDLERMGPINQLALKDYEEASARLEFYSSQAEDLLESKKDLQKVVSTIDDKIESLFRSALEDVAASFEATFATLFPGGKGRLYLQDPSQPLLSGVEVEAKPAGKSVKRLSLLSGGERSLAALAFLFSIYRSRPSPFYVLDEVEAALDDINLERFLRLVAEFRDYGQMVIITHQKRTVEVADCLYGVSMQSDGVSKVLSYKVSESVAYS